MEDRCMIVVASRAIPKGDQVTGKDVRNNAMQNDGFFSTCYLSICLFMK